MWLEILIRPSAPQVSPASGSAKRRNETPRKAEAGQQGVRSPSTNFWYLPHNGLRLRKHELQTQYPSELQSTLTFFTRKKCKERKLCVTPRYRRSRHHCHVVDTLTLSSWLLCAPDCFAHQNPGNCRSAFNSASTPYEVRNNV